MAWWFLFGELRGIAGLAAIYLITGGPARPRLAAGAGAWSTTCASTGPAATSAGVRVLFGLTFEIEGLEQAGPGPVLVLIRHASIIDNALPDAVIGHAHGLGLRFVLKRELEMLPTIDIGGRWVPTNFVRRASDDPAGEVARLRRARARPRRGRGRAHLPGGHARTPPRSSPARRR